MKNKFNEQNVLTYVQICINICISTVVATMGIKPYLQVNNENSIRMGNFHKMLPLTGAGHNVEKEQFGEVIGELVNVSLQLQIAFQFD